MRQKQRLLALLIAFPVTFFALLAFMSWKVAKAPVSRVVDIRTVGIPGASSQASSLPDHGMPADTARAEDAVRAFFRRGGRVVVVLMHPVSRFLDMQVCAALLALHPALAAQRSRLSCSCRTSCACSGPTGRTWTGLGSCRRCGYTYQVCRRQCA